MTTTTEPPRWISSQEAAKQLSFHPRTIIKMIEDRELDGVKVRGRWRINAHSLERLMIDRNTPSP